MARRKTVRKKPVTQIPEEKLVLLEDESVITNYDKVRFHQRGLDTFTVALKNGEEIEVLGHDIALDSKGTQDTKLPIYQIFEYVPVKVQARHRRAYNNGKLWEPDTQVVYVEHSEDEQYVQVVKAILWPGEWICVTRVFGQ